MTQATVEKALNGDLDKGVVAEYSTSEDGHGRHEERSYVVVHDVKGLRDREAWKKASTVAPNRPPSKRGAAAAPMATYERCHPV